MTLLARWIAGVIERQMSVQMLTKLVKQTPGMLYQYRLWPDGSSAIPFASPGIRDIFGVSSEDVAEDATPCFGQVHPEDFPSVRDSITNSARNLEVWHQQYRVRNGDHWRWIEGRATPENLADNSTMCTATLPTSTKRRRSSSRSRKARTSCAACLSCRPSVSP